MSGRRSHVRFAVSPGPEGVLRVVRDVAVRCQGAGEMVAVSREPGVLDEQLVLEVPQADGVLAVRVQVAESRPVIVDGSVRHRIRLRIVNGVQPGMPLGCPATEVHGGANVDG
jgi:hypothetical protein